MSLKNVLVSISEMDELIGLPTKAEVVDDYGALKVTDAQPNVDVRAKVRYVSVNEADSIKQEKTTQEIKVWMRYNSSVTYEYMVYWKSRYWDIIGIESTPKSRFTVIKARLIEQ